MSRTPRLQSKTANLFALAVWAISFSPASALAQQGPSGAAQEEARLSEHASRLIAQMTLEEKAAQMQDQAAAIPRLGIPAYGYWNEGLHGVARNGHATNFPQAIGLAATWDQRLLHDVGETVSVEARAKYSEAIREGSHARYRGLTFWSPNINIFRDPRWGRGQETYGEDPFLTARLGVQFVEGLQGDDPQHPRVVATPKHFAVHSGPESSRHEFDVQPSAHDLEDTYLPAFRATLTEAHAWSTMCAYNAIKGSPACASHLLLGDYLRGAWKFNGYVTSDCGAIDDIFGGHKFQPDGPAAVAAAIKAGTDLDCGHIYRQIPEAVHRKLIGESEVDTALHRLLMARLRLGVLDGKETGPYADTAMAEVNSSAHHALALRAASESIVLLKNENATLPLTKAGLKVAVVGPTAEYYASVQGNYSGTPLNMVFPLAGMRKAFGVDHVAYAQGSSFADGVMVPISRTALTPTASAGAEGLTGEYFNSFDLSGKPQLVRTDESPNFNYEEVSPGPGVDAKIFSVRWSATLTPPAPGSYRLGVHLGPCYECGKRISYRLYLDGKLLIDSNNKAKGATGKSDDSVPVDFTDTRGHALRVEYARNEAGGIVEVVWQAPKEALLAQASEAAKRSDVVVAFVGLSTYLEGEEMNVKLPGFSGGDRTSLDLPAAQQELLETVAATGKPLIVVLMSGSALSVNWAQQHAAAVLEAWYPGEDGGTAIADVLLGKSNPGGRLPVTFYASADDLPDFSNYSMAGRTYRFFQGKALYPFGYGLSYTTFAYDGVKLSAPTLVAGQPLTVRATVKNTGGRAGDEVVQLYLEPMKDGSPAEKALRGFTRVHLEAKQSQTVSFVLGDRDLSTVSADGARRVAPGAYRITVGGGQPATGAPGKAAMLTITGTVALPK